MSYLKMKMLKIRTRRLTISKLWLGEHKPEHEPKRKKKMARDVKEKARIITTKKCFKGTESLSNTIIVIIELTTI